MPSLIYNSLPDDLAKAKIDLSAVTVKVMLLTDTYVPDKNTHLKRSSLTNEVVGTGYVAGGAVVPVTITKDVANDRLDITFEEVAFPSSTITARQAVYYVARGGVATADELLFVNDFGSNKVSTDGTFTLQASHIRTTTSLV